MKALKTKKQILRTQISNARSRNNERQLQKELSRFFARLGDKIQKNLNEYYNENMVMGQVDLIIKPVMEAQSEYYHILQKYDKREYKLGQAEAQRLVRLSRRGYSFKAVKPKVKLDKRFSLFGTLRGAEEDLFERVFIASQQTMARVEQSIMTIILEGYKSGKGIDKVANDLNRRFDQLTTWESKRIARTEIHNSHNTAVNDSYNEMGIEYTMWIAADDERTRESHLEINGEIIRLGDTYSNGLKYPGDTDGPIEEWINCRCSNAPYVIPYSYVAPDFSPFREEDLIKVERKG